MHPTTAPSSPTQDPNGEFDLWIEAGHSEKRYWRDLWRYRELLFILAWRDVAVRYKQTVAGAAWALLQPLLNMIIMTVVFGKLAGLPSLGNAPYAIMVFAAILPWQFFSNALSNAGQSVVSNAGMISKVYFPRAIIPTSSVLVSLVDFLVSLLILAGLMAWYEYWPTWRLIALPIFTFIALLAATGAGLFITALTVRYRDFRFIVPFVVQFGMYLSPVAFSSDLVRQKLAEHHMSPAWFFVYCLNPLVGVIDGFRWAILGGGAVGFHFGTLVSLAVAVGLFVGGLAFFRKTERMFADII